MLKRVTKVTSLLVAAASIASIAIYYVTEDNKFNKIDDTDSGDTLGDGLQQNQYAEIGDDGDTYVDLKNGYKVVDDDIRQTMIDNGARKVKNKIKKDNDGRFDENYYSNSVPAEPKRSGDKSTFFDGFSGTWSHYKYKLKDTLISDKLSGRNESYSTVYADLDGNYVDGDYNLGNLTVSTTSASVTIKNTQDTYVIEEDGQEYELKAEIKEINCLSEGPGDLERTAELTVYKKVKDASDDTYRPATSDLFFGSGKNMHKVANGDSVTVIQKFTKDQAADSAEGIKYPKSSDIYFIADEDGNPEELLGLSQTSKIGSVGYGFGMTSFNYFGAVSAYIDLQNQKLYAETISLKKKGSFKYVDLSDHDEIDLASTGAWAMPGGILWCINDGYIETWDETNNDFEKKYRVDTSMDKISMNDNDNIIVWNEDTGIYSTIYNKPKAGDTVASIDIDKNAVTTGTAVTIGNATKTGWVKNSDGAWSYINSDGSKAIGWIKDNEKWYYLKSDGIMVTGWLNDNSNWYCLNASGAMQTGWINDNGIWYYCDQAGAMLANTSVDGYLLGSDGAWIK